jgi:hypothetical protein
VAMMMELQVSSYHFLNEQSQVVMVNLELHHSYDDDHLIHSVLLDLMKGRLQHQDYFLIHYYFPFQEIHFVAMMYSCHVPNLATVEATCEVHNDDTYVEEVHLDQEIVLHLVADDDNLMNTMQQTVMQNMANWNHCCDSFDTSRMDDYNKTP